MIHSAKAGGGHPVILDLWPLMAGDFYPEIPGGVKTCGSLKQFENHAAASHQITIHRHLGH